MGFVNLRSSLRSIRPLRLAALSPAGPATLPAPPVHGASVAPVSSYSERVRALAHDGPPLVAPLVVLTGITWAAFALSPWLIQWPLLLIALNPRLMFLLVVAPRVGLVEFTVVATARLCVADPFNYLLGVRYGPGLRERLERSRVRRLMLRIMPAERTACAVGVWVRPSQPVLLWAGSLGLCPRFVAVADIVTTAAYIAALHQGMALKPWSRPWARRS
jgi:hypothetical protein